MQLNCALKMVFFPFVETYKFIRHLLDGIFLHGEMQEMKYKIIQEGEFF